MNSSVLEARIIVMEDVVKVDLMRYHESQLK